MFLPLFAANFRCVAFSCRKAVNYRQGEFKTFKTKGNTIMIDWSAFYANGGWQGDCDPAAYDDGRDEEVDGISDDYEYDDYDSSDEPEM